MTLTPRHRAVLGALSDVPSGMYLGSIKGRLTGILRGADVPSILDDLLAAGLVTRTAGAPTLWRRAKMTQGGDR